MFLVRNEHTMCLRNINTNKTKAETPIEQDYYSFSMNQTICERNTNSFKVYAIDLRDGIRTLKSYDL